jgi:cell shape-determining protein MreD
MSSARFVAAVAAVVTALLLQATLVGPLAMSWPVSLPAVLVAAVALVEGPATGISFGFTVGLLADLGSSHPAGVLALTWLGLGLLCGLAGDRRSVLGDAALVALGGAAAAGFATLALSVVHADGASAGLALRTAGPAGLGDALFALAVVPLVHAALRTHRLRPRRAPMTEFGLGAARG